MQITRMTKGEWGKTRAFFDLETEDRFTIKGFKIVDGINGLFVSLPSVKKEDKYENMVFVDKEVLAKLNVFAINHYNNYNERPKPADFISADINDIGDILNG